MTKKTMDTTNFFFSVLIKERSHVWGFAYNTTPTGETMMNRPIQDGIDEKKPVEGEALRRPRHARVCV